jgi:hypothetical protein
MNFTKIKRIRSISLAVLFAALLFFAAGPAVHVSARPERGSNTTSGKGKGGKKKSNKHSICVVAQANRVRCPGGLKGKSGTCYFYDETNPHPKHDAGHGFQKVSCKNDLITNSSCPNGKKNGDCKKQKFRGDPAMDCSKKTGGCDLVKKYANPLIATLSILVGLAVVIGVVWGGIEFATASNDPQKVGQAKRHIQNSLMGLVAYLLLFAFLEYILPVKL